MALNHHELGKDTQLEPRSCQHDDGPEVEEGIWPVVLLANYRRIAYYCSCHCNCVSFRFARLRGCERFGSGVATHREWFDSLSNAQKAVAILLLLSSLPSPLLYHSSLFRNAMPGVPEDGRCLFPQSPSFCRNCSPFPYSLVLFRSLQSFQDDETRQSRAVLRAAIRLCHDRRARS